MQIVIEIPDEEYNRMKDLKMFGNVTVWKNAICNGTPLPKGHGRLIYAKDVGEYLTLADVPTIIEADGGGEDDLKT